MDLEVDDLVKIATPDGTIVDVLYKGICERWRRWPYATIWCPVYVADLMKKGRIINISKYSSSGNWFACVISVHDIISKYSPKKNGEMVSARGAKFKIIGKYFDGISYKYATIYELGTSNEYFETEPINEYNKRLYEIDDKFLWQRFVILTQAELEPEQKNSTGMNCMNPSCRVECPYVDQPNCPNNVFMCFGCRSNPITYSVTMGLFK